MRFNIGVCRFGVAVRRDSWWVATARERERETQRFGMCRKGKGTKGKGERREVFG